MFYRAKPFDEYAVLRRGYRQWMYRVGRERGMFNASYLRLCDQDRAIRKNGWSSEVKLEAIRRLVQQSEEQQKNCDTEHGGEILPRLNVQEEVNEIN